MCRVHNNYLLSLHVVIMCTWLLFPCFLFSGPGGVQGSIWSGHTVGGGQRLWTHLQGVPAHQRIRSLSGWQGDQGGCVSAGCQGWPVPADCDNSACAGGGTASTVLPGPVLWLHVREQPYHAAVSQILIPLPHVVISKYLIMISLLVHSLSHDLTRAKSEIIFPQSFPACRTGIVAIYQDMVWQYLLSKNKKMNWRGGEGGGYTGITLPICSSLCVSDRVCLVSPELL